MKDGAGDVVVEDVATKNLAITSGRNDVVWDGNRALALPSAECSAVNADLSLDYSGTAGFTAGVLVRCAWGSSGSLIDFGSGSIVLEAAGNSVAISTGITGLAASVVLPAQTTGWIPVVMSVGRVADGGGTVSVALYVADDQHTASDTAAPELGDVVADVSLLPVGTDTEFAAFVVYSKENAPSVADLMEYLVGVARARSLSLVGY